eukprot:7862849-Alexandrium_andersonii.AAC.1
MSAFRIYTLQARYPGLPARCPPCFLLPRPRLALLRARRCRSASWPARPTCRRVGAIARVLARSA